MSKKKLAKAGAAALLLLALGAVGWAVYRWAASVPEPDAAPPTVDTAAEEALLREMAQVEREMEQVALERSEAQKRMETLRLDALENDEEIARLTRELEEDRDLLLEKLRQLEGVPERRAEIESLVEQNDALLAEFHGLEEELHLRQAEQAVARGLDNADSILEEATAAAERVDSQQVELVEQHTRHRHRMERLQREIEAIQERAREENWAVKELARMGLEKQLRLGARLNAVSGVREQRDRLTELAERHRELAARHAELERALAGNG